MITVVWQHRYEPRISGVVQVMRAEAKGLIQHIEARGPYKATAQGVKS